MTWNSKKEAEPRVHDMWYTDNFFCIWPRRTREGITVWFESCSRKRQWFDWNGSKFWRPDTVEFHAYPRQMAKHGLKW